MKKDENLKPCSCVNVDIGSYDKAVLVDMPSHMQDYQNRRLEGLPGLLPGICIDECILEEIRYLWSLDITTYGSCCGHNKVQSMVNVDDKDIDKMLELGYVQNHKDLNRKDTFRLKSAG